jgi:hypothetical protein
VPDEDDLRDADLDEATSQLSAGLKVCRSVIDNYRSILSGENAATDDGVEQPNSSDQRPSVQGD